MGNGRGLCRFAFGDGDVYHVMFEPIGDMSREFNDVSDAALVMFFYQRQGVILSVAPGRAFCFSDFNKFDDVLGVRARVVLQCVAAIVAGKAPMKQYMVGMSENTPLTPKMMGWREDWWHEVQIAAYESEAIGDYYPVVPTWDGFDREGGGDGKEQA